jgi:hypothetical protein
VERPYKQGRQVPLSDKPVIKEDNKLYRVQYPMRTEVSLVIFVLFKVYISAVVKKVAKAHPQTKIIFGKAGGSWWKPEYRIIIGGKTKKAVQAAAEMLQKHLNRKKNKK